MRQNVVLTHGEGLAGDRPSISATGGFLLGPLNSDALPVELGTRAYDDGFLDPRGDMWVQIDAD